MDEVNAANSASMKNAPPTQAPYGISLNAMGRVTKKRPGPPAGSSPNANTSGKMAKPATNATRVSAATMVPAEPGMS